MTSPTERTAWSRLAPYVPRAVVEWDLDGPHHRRVEGSLVSADISGFTALSERLAGYGREGAEELTVLLNRCFGGMIEIVDAYGGDVLKFGGDALLILFTGEDHTGRAAAACHQMRHLIQRRWSTPLVSSVELGISQGIHSGEFSLHLVHAGYHELWVVGPGMSAAVQCEGAAERGQILLSHAASARLHPDVLGEPTSDGYPLVSQPDVAASLAAPVASDERLQSFVPSWLVEQVDAAGVSEHRAVTVGFVFFGGVDDVLVAEGYDAVHARLQRLSEVVRNAMEQYGIYWLASDVYPGGGKIIVTAGAPRSAGDDEDAAVRALRTILDADVGLPLRVGVNRGHVFMGDLGSSSRRTFTVMGDAVNLAARLMQKSQPGQLVASSAVLDVMPSPVEAHALEPFMVKGKSEPIHAHLVDGVRDKATQPEKESTSIPFVGRESEVTLLNSLADAARVAQGTVVDLVGEPGIGKTRLVTELVDANPDFSVLSARGGRYSRRSPYFAVRQTLRGLCGTDLSASATEAGDALRAWVSNVAPDLVEWLPLIAVPFDADVPMTPTVDRVGAANRAAKLRETVGDLLAAALAEPTILVVDDAHWLDEASDLLLGHLAIRARELPWLLVAIHRADTTCFASVDRQARAIHLGELSEVATRALTSAAVDASVGGSADDIDDLLSRGVTNPLFILELVRAGYSAGDTTPDSIEAVVTARIDTLAARDRLVLREGAVLGSVIDTDLLADATGMTDLRDPQRWRSLSSFVDQEAPGVLRFSHSLYREVAYEGLSFRRRQTLHRSVGEVLEARAGDTWAEASELLSLHFHAARDWGRSWRYSVTAGDRARGKYANSEAANYYARALDAPRRRWPSRTEAADVAERLGDVLEIAGRFGDADEAFDLARRVGEDSSGTVRLLRKRGVLREREGRYSQALRWYSRGLTLAEGSDAAAEGDLCIAYAGVRFRQGDTESSLEWAHRAERIARRLGDRRMLAHASYLLMIGYGVLRRPEVAHYRDISLPLFEAEGDLVGQANVLNNLGMDAKEQGHWAEALDYNERSLAVRDQAGDVIGAAIAQNNSGEILLDQGHLDEAEKRFRIALRAWRRSNYAVGVAMATCYLGRLEARRGHVEESRALFEEALERYERINASYFAVEAQIFRLEAEAMFGNPSGRGADGALSADAERLGDPLMLAIVTRTNAWIECLAGRFEAAETLATEAESLARSIQYPYEAALALMVRATSRAARGIDPRADRDRAHALLDSLGVVSLPPSLH